MELKDINLLTFESLSFGDLSIEDVIKKIREFLNEDPKSEYSLVIGTDSHEKYDGDVKKLNLVTAVLVHRRGYGGRYFWTRAYLSKIHTLRDKIYAETMTSLNFASIFVPHLKEKLNGESPNYFLEIHIDVGEHGDTRDMIKEVVGMVTGNGYVAKTKPEAYGASYVADKHT